MKHSGFIALGVLVPITAGGAFFAWRWTQRGPERASVSGAVDRFRTSSTVEIARRPLQPRPGVYVYDGTGSESLSFLSTSQPQGPTQPGTVTVTGNGCWTFRIDFNSFHSQTWNRCATGGRLVESGGRTDQRFDFVTFKMSEHSTVTCTSPFVVADPSAKAGSTKPVRCNGHSSTTNANFTQTGVVTFVGAETLDIGGTPVSALHEREQLLLSGDQTGSVRIDLWLAASDGLPLSETHEINVVSGAPPPLNHVTYSEHGNWRLKSLTPRT